MKFARWYLPTWRPFNILSIWNCFLVFFFSSCYKYAIGDDYKFENLVLYGKIYVLMWLMITIFYRQDNANALKAQLDQQKNVVENLVSNTRVWSSDVFSVYHPMKILKLYFTKINLRIQPKFSCIITLVGHVNIIINSNCKLISRKSIFLLELWKYIVNNSSWNCYCCSQ